jgi:hypothetical protein
VAHRRQLLRYVDAAPNSAARRRRIRETLGFLEGRPADSPRPAAQRPLWTCPKCGNQFVTRNMYHSCARYELEPLFAGKAPVVRRIFERFRRMAEALGSVKVIPYRDKIAFMVRVRFAGATPRKEWMDLGFWLRRRVDDPRFHRIETLTPTAHVHLLRITDPAQLDGRVAEWLAESHAIGCQQDAPPARSRVTRRAKMR